MRTNSSVRTPSLANSRINSDRKRGRQSIGDALRSAHQKMIVRRMILISFCAILAIAIVYAVTAGYFDKLVDLFYSMLV